MDVRRAFYFVAISITTVGFGDVTPSTTAGKLFAILLLLFGIPMLGGVLVLTLKDIMRAVEHIEEKENDGGLGGRDLDDAVQEQKEQAKREELIKKLTRTMHMEDLTIDQEQQRGETQLEDDTLPIEPGDGQRNDGEDDEALSGGKFSRDTHQVVLREGEEAALEIESRYEDAQESPDEQRNGPCNVEPEDKTQRDRENYVEQAQQGEKNNLAPSSTGDAGGGQGTMFTAPKLAPNSTATEATRRRSSKRSLSSQRSSTDSGDFLFQFPARREAPSTTNPILFPRRSTTRTTGGRGSKRQSSELGRAESAERVSTIAHGVGTMLRGMESLNPPAPDWLGTTADDAYMPHEQPWHLRARDFLLGDTSLRRSVSYLKFQKFFQSLLIMCVPVALGAILVVAFEDFDTVDSLYWSVVMCTTTGYGDLALLDADVHWVWAIFGIFSTFSFSIGIANLMSLDLDIEQIYDRAKGESDE
eukprot:GSA25T00022928001.1